MKTKADEYDRKDNASWRTSRALDPVKDVIGDYLQSLPPDHIGPGPADIVTSPAFQSVIFETPSHVELAKTSFTDAIDKLPEFSVSWRASKCEKLWERLWWHEKQPIQLQLNAEPSRERRIQLMELAFAGPEMLHCIHCNANMSYPEVLIHPCHTRFSYYCLDGLRDNSRLKPFFNSLKQLPWSASNISVSQPWRLP
jgi:hypothetical protein